MKLVGADANAELGGEQELQGKVNYMIGNDRAKWRTGIPTFRKVRYDDVWSGVDMLWYGTQTALEYDFVLSRAVKFPRCELRLKARRRCISTIKVTC